MANSAEARTPETAATNESSGSMLANVHRAAAADGGPADGGSAAAAPSPAGAAAPAGQAAAAAAAKSPAPPRSEADLRAEFEALCGKQAAGRSVAWAHLEPILLTEPSSGAPKEVKLRCLHCGSLFSARNPSRTVGDHMRACRKYEGELPDTLRVKRVRTDAGPMAEPASYGNGGVHAAGGAVAGRGDAPATSGAAYYRPADQPRDIPLRSGRAALLFVDTQNFNCHRDGAVGSQLLGEHYYWQRVQQASQVWADLAAAARGAEIEVMFTVIQSLTHDGRDRGRDYKLSGFHVPPGCWDARVLDCMRPLPDEIVLPKTSSSVFGSTVISYLLRNMGIDQLVLCGALTDQCVEHAVRDAADASFLVTMVTDACITHSQARHDASIAAVAGYCRQVTAAELIAELHSMDDGGCAAASEPDGFGAASTPHEQKQQHEARQQQQQQQQQPGSQLPDPAPRLDQQRLQSDAWPTPRQ